MSMKLKRRFTELLALCLAAAMTIGLAGCGGKSPEVPAQAEGRTVIYYAASYVTAQSQAAYEELVQTYNNGQGVTDGVFVQLRQNPGAISGLDSALRGNYQYDVLELRDDEYKTLAMQGGNYFIPLESYLTEELKSAMQFDQIPDALVNRFRMNTTPSEDGKYLAGEGAALLAVPNGSDPQVLYYNKTILKNCGINIISVPETELEAYNQANAATLQPHGYAEYMQPPYADALSSKNEAGEFVYKVFNECIAMNWEEQRLLARAFQKQYAYEYGFMSEWWFFMGFSVGGDCVGWNGETGNYQLTLTDQQPGYLALEDITVNGRSYGKGQVLTYEEKLFLNTNDGELSKLEGKVYPLPSQYDAILEFTRLGVPADKQADVGVYGYGVAPSTTENRTARFSSGTDCPFLIEYFSQAQSFQNILGDALGMAVPAQYREYEGGSTYEKNGQQYLKVIGQTYDGQVYTGQLHEENGTPIVGEAATASKGAGLFLPANTRNQNYEAAMKFAAWVAGPEGQKILSQSNKMVPNQVAYGLEEYAQSEQRLLSGMWAGPYMAQAAEIGDYTYFTSLTWITEWSMAFNKDVREGNLTLTDFIAQKQAAANNSLKGMRLRILGR